MDLNADLGEDSAADGQLLAVVTSASIACGSHAGDPLTMLEMARLAAGHGVCSCRLTAAPSCSSYRRLSGGGGGG